jgi:hypothetical protein
MTDRIAREPTLGVGLFQLLAHPTPPEGNRTPPTEGYQNRLSFAKNASAGIALWSKDSISLKTRDIARLVSKAPRRRYEVISL